MGPRGPHTAPDGRHCASRYTRTACVSSWKALASCLTGRFWQSPSGYSWEGCRGEGFSPPFHSLVAMVTVGICWRRPPPAGPSGCRGPGWAPGRGSPWVAACVSSRCSLGSHPTLCKQASQARGPSPQPLRGVRGHLSQRSGGPPGPQSSPERASTLTRRGCISLGVVGLSSSSHQASECPFRCPTL